MAISRPLNHQIWDIAWPAILANISIPMLGLVDTAILGHLESSQYLAAVALGSVILSFLYWGFNFLRMGTTGLVAKATGAGDDDRALLILGQSCILAVAIAILLVLAHPIWLFAGISLIAPGSDLAPLASSYVSIRIFSAPAVLLTYACIGWFIGRQNTRWPLVIVLITNLANIALDFLLIVALKMNSDGAALASVLAEYIGLGLAVYGIRRSISPDATRLLPQLWNWPDIKHLLSTNRDLFVRTMCLLSSFAFFTAMGERLGIQVLAANTIMLQLLMLAAYGMDGIAYAAEALAGNRAGAADLAGFYRVVRRCALWCAALALSITGFFFFFSQSLFGLLTDIPDILGVLENYQWWLIALTLCAAPSYLLDGVFIGTAKTRYMMQSMLISALLVYLPCWYLSRDFGNHGLWFSFTLFHVARGATLQFWFWQLSRNNLWSK
jgi:MATE family multidrug resistance protein